MQKRSPFAALRFFPFAALWLFKSKLSFKYLYGGHLLHCFFSMCSINYTVTVLQPLTWQRSATANRISSFDESVPGWMADHPSQTSISTTSQGKKTLPLMDLVHFLLPSSYLCSFTYETLFILDKTRNCPDYNIRKPFLALIWSLGLSNSFCPFWVILKTQCVLCW